MKNFIPKINNKITILKEKSNKPIKKIFDHINHIDYSCFLNSSLKNNISRYSFIGLNPFLIFQSKNNLITLQKNNKKLILQSNPFDILKQIFKEYKIENNTNLPFISGAIGYFSYELKNLLEKLPQKAIDNLNIPDIILIFYQILIIHDNKEPNTLYISITNTIPNNKNGTNTIIEKIKKIINSKETKNKTIQTNTNIYTEPILSNFTKPQYLKSIEKILKYIKNGDIYQVCLSQQFKTKYPYPIYNLYKNLNKINPAPFSAYFNFPTHKILSSSPELFIKYENNIIETRPMKGTNPRGKNKKQNLKIKKNLINSKKEYSELSMIVDLERNDLGKISIPGSIKVIKHRKIEQYATVFQCISIIKSIAKKNISPIDIIKAMFPGGSISGCPKIRALEIIDELEPTTRSIYTGSIGYISFHNTMQLNIAIRTIIEKNNNLFFNVGSGIVADSNPEKEYTETLHKAKALIQSINNSVI